MRGAKEASLAVKNNGIVTRLDIPFLASHRAGGTNAGLGDIYAQAFVLPYRHNRFLAGEVKAQKSISAD